MSTNDAVVSLIGAAKELRSIADELGNVEVKARILDVLVELQEFRAQGEPVSADEPLPVAAEPENSAEEQDGQSAVSPAPLLGAFTQEHARMESSGEIETYAFHHEEPEPAEEETAKDKSPSTESDKKSKEGKPVKAKKKAKAKEKQDGATKENDSPPEEELSEEQRFKLAEQRIVELEPLHQAALKRMNDVLTPEQAARKKAATKKGLAAGLKGKQLQEAVMGVLELSAEQQQQLDKGRHDLHQVRLAIGKQVEGLLSKQQLDKLLRSHRH